MDTTTLCTFLWAVGACIVALVAAKYNRPMWAWFAIALVLTPLLALVVLCVLGTKAGASRQPAFMCRFSKEPKPCIMCHRCGFPQE